MTKRSSAQLTCRPTGDLVRVNYSDELFQTILDRIIDGESLRKICESDSMPNRGTVLKWLRDDQSLALATRYAHARARQADYLEEEMADIEQKTLDGGIDPAIARVVLASKQWRASKLAPKVYGDKIAVGGADDLPPVAPLSIEEGARRIAFIFARAIHKQEERELLQREALEPILRATPTLK